MLTSILYIRVSNTPFHLRFLALTKWYKVNTLIIVYTILLKIVK